MRLNGEVSDDGEIWRVSLALTRAEAAELRDALDDPIGHFDRSETAAWHAHVIERLPDRDQRLSGVTSTRRSVMVRGPNWRENDA